VLRQLRKLRLVLVLACAIPAAISTAAADGAATFQEVCADCHGKSGEGKAQLAPPLKGNPFLKSASPADIAALVKNGRTGAAKKYPQFATGMPAQPIYDEKLDEVVKYVREDLQK